MVSQAAAGRNLWIDPIIQGNIQRIMLDSGLRLLETNPNASNFRSVRILIDKTILSAILVVKNQEEIDAQYYFITWIICLILEPLHALNPV